MTNGPGAHRHAPIVEPVPWAHWWLWLWGAVAIALIALTFFIPFKWWAAAAAAGFGTMEAIGLRRPNDPYPPLTHVIRRYVPRWAAYAAIYGFTGAAGSVWLTISKPQRLGPLFALLGWFTTHFDVTFDSELEQQERAKRQRLVAKVLRRGGESTPEPDRPSVTAGAQTSEST
jgi:hypothetical protein